MKDIKDEIKKVLKKLAGNDQEKLEMALDKLDEKVPDGLVPAPVRKLATWLNITVDDAGEILEFAESHGLTFEDLRADKSTAYDILEMLRDG